MYNNGNDNDRVRPIRPQQEEDPLAQLINEFKKQFGGGNGGGGARRGSGGGSGGDNQLSLASVLGIITIVILGYGLYSAFYTIETYERGVVLRFGRFKESVTEGLHFKIPFGVDQVYKVRSSVMPMDFGYREQGTRGGRTRYEKQPFQAESLMLTGDLNVADVEWQLLYQVVDPVKFLFTARDVSRNLRDISMSIMRRVIGDRSATEVLTTERIAIATEAKALIQKTVDDYDLGVDVVNLKLQDVNPPDRVKPAFNEVNAAKQQQEETINNAEREYNRVIPEARGQAEKIIADAQGYATEVVNQAEGDVAKFASMLQEYEKAPSITKDRLYLDTMEKVIGRVQGLTIIDKDLNGIIPLYGTTPFGRSESVQSGTRTP